MLSVILTMTVMTSPGHYDLQNQANLSHHNNKYEVNLEQFNSSNCSIPYANISYDFECPSNETKFWCCAQEYEKLNTSFGSAECNKYELNNTFVRFNCQEFNGKFSNLTLYEKIGIAVGIAVFMILFLLCCVRCLTYRTRNRYDRI